MQTSRELVSRVYERLPYIISEDLLHDGGLMFIGGPPKSYKSFMINSLCCHLAAGTPLFGATRKRNRATTSAFNVQRPYRVLLLEQEIGDFSLRDRIKPLADNLPEPERELFYTNLYTHSCDRNLRLDKKEGVMAIAALVEAAKPEILIFDPLIEFHHADENSASEMSNVMRGVDYLRDRYKLAVIMSHHCGKPSDVRGGPDALRGSSAIFGKGDSYLMLQIHNRRAGIIIVEPTIRRGVPIKRFLVRLDWTNLRMHFIDWYTQKVAAEALKTMPEESEWEQ